MQAVVDRLTWHLARVISLLLDASDREAAYGDLIELKVSPRLALREVLGLAVRRQAAYWVDVGPWVALVTIALPVGWLLSHISLRLADSSAIYVFLYVQNWTWGFVASPGARHEVIRVASVTLLDALAVVAWAWTAGYALGQLSRRTVWLTGALFGLVVLVGTVGVPTSGRTNGFNDAVFSLPFYAVVFPRLLRVCLVLVPAWCGVRQSIGSAVSRRRLVAVGAIGVAVLTVVSARGPTEALEPGRNSFLLWPAAYLVISSFGTRGRRPQVKLGDGTCV
jgi:hypothetical protein